MGTWDEVMGKGVNANPMPMPAGAGIQMQLNINIPFSKMLGGLVDQVKSGIVSPDEYYAILDEYEKILGKFRDVKL